MEKKEITLPGKIIQIQKNVGIIENEAKVIKIRNEDELNSAVEFLQKVRGWKKRVEEVRLSFTKPLNDHISNINKEFKETSLPLIEIDKKVSDEIGSYREKEAEKIRIKQEKEAEKQRIEFEKEQEKKQKELEKQRDEMTKKEAKEKEKEIKNEEFVATPTIIQDKEIGNGSIKMKTRKKWDYEIEDESLIPKKYFKVDEVAIGKAVRSEGIREIKGIRIFQTESLI